MCGIVGAWSYAAPDVGDAFVQRSVHALGHRGPDGSGSFYDPTASLRLGHTRLAVIDTRTLAAQPMTDSTGRWTVVFNGEIYNYVEIRRALERLGRRFDTASDTEVLLQAFIEWGPACQERFNGMWAFAVWDAVRSELFLSRDRFGVKPLYIGAADGRFVFASEVKVFALTGPWIDGFRMELYRFSKITELESAGLTILRGVSPVPPGHQVLVTASGSRRVTRWWNTLDHLPSVPPSYDERVEELRGRLGDACELRLRSDVPVGTSLSGGLDSSVIAALVHERIEGHHPHLAQKAYTRTFTGTPMDEAHWAERVAASLGVDLIRTDHGVGEAIDRFEEIVHVLEDAYLLPLGVWSHYRGMMLDGTVVSIDGHGADELFAGYPSTVRGLRRTSLQLGRISAWRELDRLHRRLKGEDGSVSIGRTIGDVTQDAMATTRMLFERRPRRTQHRKRVVPDGVDEILEALRSRANIVAAEARSLSPLNRILYNEFHHGMLPAVLRNFDRMSMANGVEIRSPYLDWRVVTYAFALPDSDKLGDGFSKRILRDVGSVYLPEDVTLRLDKIGFRDPVSDLMSDGLVGIAARGIASGTLEEVCSAAGLELGVIATAIEGEDWKQLAHHWRFVQAAILLRLLRNSHDASSEHSRATAGALE
jgi:asparagine synthase (glutamine-hydrolysing)